MSSLAPTAPLCCSAFRSKTGKVSLRSPKQRPFHRIQTAGEKKTMRKNQVLAETPNKTIYTQLGTLTQILLSWELIKMGPRTKGIINNFYPLCSALAPFLSLSALLSAHTHIPSLYESQGSPTEKNELLISL